MNFLVDIPDRKEVEEKIRFMARHDPLTGLPNRTLLFDRLNRALAGRVESLFRASDTVASMGGVELVVLLPAVKSLRCVASTGENSPGHVSAI